MKKNRRKPGIGAMLFGVALIVAALVLFLHNIKQDRRAGALSQLALARVFSVISEQHFAESRSDFSAHSEELDPGPIPGLGNGRSEYKIQLSEKQPVAKIDGFSYLGFLSIPVLNLNLPVLFSRDQESLEIGPCRHFGSCRSGDLVLAGHNYNSHFGRIHTLKAGDLIVFTDIFGVSSRFKVEQLELVAATAVDQIKNSGWDLTLYTCSYGGQQRLVVSCRGTDQY